MEHEQKFAEKYAAHLSISKLRGHWFLYNRWLFRVLGRWERCFAQHFKNEYWHRAFPGADNCRGFGNGLQSDWIYGEFAFRLLEKQCDICCRWRRKCGRGQANPYEASWPNSGNHQQPASRIQCKQTLYGCFHERPNRRKRILSWCPQCFAKATEERIDGGELYGARQHDLMGRWGCIDAVGYTTSYLSLSSSMDHCHMWLLKVRRFSDIRWRIGFLECEKWKHRPFLHDSCRLSWAKRVNQPSHHQQSLHQRQGGALSDFGRSDESVQSLFGIQQE